MRPATRMSTPHRRRAPLLSVTAAAVLLLAAASQARAHEPLWGETPTIFGFGVIHPEVMAGYHDAGDLKGGGIRSRLFHERTVVGYAPSKAINLMLEIPWMEAVREQRIGGGRRRVVINGLGDLTLMAKRRFSVHQAESLNIQHSLMYGIKLPTGESDHRDPSGRRASPFDQPGTGKPGFLLGYAGDREQLIQTIWGSVIWTRDVGGGFQRGDMVEADTAYGRWLVRPNQASELGYNLAAGLHGEFHASDTRASGHSADNEHTVFGFQVTNILTKGNHQLRLGVFVPVAHSGPGDHSGYPYEVRASFETFF